MGATEMKEIGKIFNCSQYTVRSFRWKHNIYDKNRKWKEVLTFNDFVKMRSQGMSLIEISKKTGIPYHSVVKAKKIYESENENLK
jgi:DNA-binding CsgD family transcriptional regulator